MKQLLRVAADLGVSVRTTKLGHGVLGEWYADEHAIYLDVRLTPVERRSVLAHELGHVYHGHRACHDDQQAERMADLYAARLLIDPLQYARLERVDPDQHHIAEELDVTADLIFTYEERCLSRVRGITYAHPRMGAWQWAFRGEVA